jgi:hypothetical protein
VYFLLYYLRLNLKIFGFKFKTKFPKIFFFKILKIINCCGFPKPPATVNNINSHGWLRATATINTINHYGRLRATATVNIPLTVAVALRCPQRLMVLTVAVGRPQRLMPRLTVAFAW